MTIAVCYPDKDAVEETFQLLKIPWCWYEEGGRYDVVIGKRADLPEYYGTVIDLEETDYFRRTSDFLNNGLPHCHEPVCDILINELRQKLIPHTLLVEIPPAPGGYSFMVALTHDVDLISLRERRWLSAGFAAFQCFCRRRFADAFRMLWAKIGFSTDPYDLFSRWMMLENELKVRSTFFFLPFSDRPGLFSPEIRAGYYPLASAPVGALKKSGWEVGLHGIDNWLSGESAASEISVIREPGCTDIGNRVHWLIYGPETFRILDRAGYSYDSTVGYNEDIGFRAGTLQVYRPAGTENLLELPLHIQDIAMFGRSCWEFSAGEWSQKPCLRLNLTEAEKQIDNLMNSACRYEGVLTLLWHYESIAAPACLEPLYRSIVSRARGKNAWIAPAGPIVRWFRNRRALRIITHREGAYLNISVEGNLEMSGIPGYRLRVFIPAEHIRSVDAPFVRGPGWIDISLTRSPVRVLIQ